MTILPVYLITSTHIQVTWLICLPWVYSISLFADECMAALFWYTEVRQRFLPPHKWNWCLSTVQIMSKHVSEGCFFFFFFFTGHEIVNEIPQPSKSSLWVCVQHSIDLGHPNAETGKCFQICSVQLVLNSKRWRFPKPLLSLYYQNMKIQ